MKTILLTGLTGFIGRHTTRALVEKYHITAIIRPDTVPDRYYEFAHLIDIIKIDLKDTHTLSDFLENNRFDMILHLGALRGGRAESRINFVNTNLHATKLFVKYATKYSSKLVFCSSVGVYGAIPAEVPAGLHTPYKADNLYHETKIECERGILRAVSDDRLRACIIRPAITYGEGDFGFPYTLTKLIDKKLLFTTKKKQFIHLTNVNLLVEVFLKVIEQGFEPGAIYNVADREKVCFQDLVNYIFTLLQRSRGVETVSRYPQSRCLPKIVFRLCTAVARLCKNELWTSRFELISCDWHFDVDLLYQDFSLSSYHTIPDFQTVVEAYLKGD
jgi:nucleoside-diphosphate-sugar epimerase